MSRSEVHDIKNNFAEGLTVAHTAFSGNVSLAAPASGNHLRIYKVTMTGPSALANDVEVELRDGSSGTVLHTFGFAAKENPEVDLGSRYIRFEDGVHFTRPSGGQEDEVFASVFYREAPNRG